MNQFKSGSIFILLIAIYFCSCYNNDSRSNSRHVTKFNKIENKNKPAVIKFPIVDSLKTLFAIADTIHHSYGDNDTVDHMEYINEAISATLHKILADTVITHQDMVSVLNIEGLGVVHSDDKRLWLFTWYENTGGSFKSNRSIVYYINKMGKSMTDDGSFTSAGAAFDTIYKLRSIKRDLYLCIGSGVGCTTCIFNTASVVELKKDSANFTYHAFDLPTDDVITYGDNNQACLTFGARDGDIEKFEFNPKNQKLTIVYLTDDNTPIQRGENEEQKRIVKHLVFNGKKFIGDVFH